MLRVTESESPDMVIFCGDGVRDFEKVTASFPNVEYRAVRGNCDYAPAVPESLLIEALDKRIFVTHGHLYHVKFDYQRAIYAAEERLANLLCFGHTHEPFRDTVRGLSILNPGSIAENRYGIAEISDGRITTRFART
jgi:putative phosphoesterase